MDVIALHGIRVFGRHGANVGERDREQPFLIDVVLEAQLERAAHSDELTDTVAYDALHAKIVEVVRTTSFSLLERLADAVMGTCFADARVVRAEVRIAKPGLLNGATPSIILRRENLHHSDG